MTAQPQYFVAKIHNMSLGRVIPVENEERGKELIRDLFFEQFGRVLNDTETDDLEDKQEVYNDEDMDNQFTFSIGSFEEGETF